MNKIDIPVVLTAHEDTLSRFLTKGAESARLFDLFELDPEKGLVIAKVFDKNKRHRILSKIAASLLDIQTAVRQAVNEGKHIILISGSFDLVHRGHASYVSEAIRAYCLKANCPREAVFVVMLADDDELISQVKASKHRDNGGDEPQKRPIETGAERLLSMAAIDGVDIAGLIPAPTANLANLPQPTHYDTEAMLQDLEENFEAFELKRIANEQQISQIHLDTIQKDKAELKKGILAYQKLEKDWKKGKLKDVPVQAWQLYTLSIVSAAISHNNGHIQSFKARAITRIVNTDDTKYLGQVLFLMKYAGIGVGLLKIPRLGGTSELVNWAIEKHREQEQSSGPWDILRNHKHQSIGKNRIKHYFESLEYIQNRLK